MPMKERPSTTAATQNDPLPQALSRTMSPGFVYVLINGKEYTGKKSWIANRLREIVASAPIDR